MFTNKYEYLKRCKKRNPRSRGLEKFKSVWLNIFDLFKNKLYDNI